jgi:hypothetical protein
MKLTTTRAALTALALAAAWKVTTAGVTAWPLGSTQLLPASWAAAAVILTIGPVAAYLLITGNWRPRT